jgi:hypothetical protein
MVFEYAYSIVFVALIYSCVKSVFGRILGLIEEEPFLLLLIDRILQ